jgi:hypothetical protein
MVTWLRDRAASAMLCCFTLGRTYDVVKFFFRPVLTLASRTLARFSFCPMSAALFGSTI